MRADFFQRNGFVNPGDLCFDIGVRDGQVTQQLLEIGAEVICVEAKHEHVKQMRDKFGDAILVVEAAVMDREDEGLLYPFKKGSATMAPVIYGAQFNRGMGIFGDPVKVKTVTLDKLAEMFGVPEFIKLDIEGAERYAFRGMTFKPRALCYEFGSGYLQEAYKCADLLEGYEFNWVQGHHGEWMAEWTTADELCIDLPEKNISGKFTWGNIFCRRRKARPDSARQG